MKNLKYIFWCTIFVIGLSTMSVAAATSNIQVTAEIFELDAIQNHIVASGNVIVHQRDVVIYGEQATYRQAEQLVHITGKVNVTKDEMNLTCKYVIADGIKNTIDAHDNVEFNYLDIKGWSDKAQYDLANRMVYLDGHPKVTQGQDTIKGEKITIDIDKQKVTTSGKAKVIFSMERLNEEPINEEPTKNQTQENSVETNNGAK